MGGCVGGVTLGGVGLEGCQASNLGGCVGGVTLGGVGLEGCYQTSNLGGCVGGVTLGGEDAIRLAIWVGVLVVSH